ncbi:MAG: arginine--tRNA ligase [Myxococcota bacterium]
MRIESWLDGIGRAAITEALGAEAPPVVRPTQDPRHGDYQLNGALPLAKREKKPPRELAGAIAATLESQDAIASATVAGPGFVNVRLDDGWVADRLGDALRDRARDGVPKVAASETIVVDFSSPNIAKQMHVGHVRSTIIGAAIVATLRFVGHEVIGDNHIGDWGTQYGLLIVGMRAFGNDAALGAKPIEELERVYRLASARAKEDDTFAAEARAELAKLQAGDADNRAMWEKMVAATRKSLDVVYDRLGISFDAWLGESAYEDALPGVVAQLLDADIAREDDGAICVFFNELEDVTDPKLKKQEVPFIVRKRDGAFLYSTSDIATVQHRVAHFGADRSVYVVDARQGQHFRQLFEVCRLLGMNIALEHVGFGVITGKGGKPIKTRDGGTVTLAGLLDEAEERAEALMVDMGLVPELVAALKGPVGIGAVKYADLSQNRTSNYQFDWDKMISFQGNSGPYLQYAYARCRSLLRKAGHGDPSEVDGAIRLEAPAERTLALRLLRWGEVVHTAAAQHHPHLICDHVYGLARDLSSFYESCPVLKSEAAARESRLALVALTARQIAAGLGLLGIAAPERM